MKLRFLALCVVGGLFAPSQAAAQVLLRLDCAGGAAYPNCGMGARPETPEHRRVFTPGAGPAGEDVVQFELLPRSSHSQFYMGWSGNLAMPPQGAVRYVRLKVRVLSPLNAASNDGTWTNKFIIFGDGPDASSRVIVEMRGTGSNNSGLETRIQRNIDGEPNRTPVVALPIGTWQNLQWEIRSSSSSSSGDGRLRFWQNNGNYSSPTAQSGNFQLNTATWSNVGLGYYSNGSLASNGNVRLQIAAFEVGTAFDPNWSTGSGGGGGTTPTAPEAPSALRIIR